MDSVAGADPGETQAPGVDAEAGQNLLEQFHPSPRLEVAVDVVAVAGMAAADQNAVSPFQKSLDHVLRVHHARAHHPDQADVLGVGQPGSAGQIGGGVGAPVTHKGNDGGFERGHHILQ
ncbi:hypothetical protein DESC_480270 [Desulfosarcina cetonica]|nr:hypothetical protein DESC_480270 [Desulfosarcina cetonica]